MPGVDEDPEEGVAEAAVDDRLQRAADLADMEGAVPLGDGLEVRGHEPVDVVLHPVRQLRCVVDHEAGPAVERPPDPERDGERIAPLDRPVPGAEQPVAGPRSCGEHEVAGQRGTVPGQELRRLPLGHAGPEASEHGTDRARRLARGPLERGQLLDLVEHAQPVVGIDEQIGGVLHQTARADPVPQLVDQERRGLHRRAPGVRLPADQPHPAAGPDALVAQDLRQGARLPTGLARQAQVLEAHASHRERGGFRHPVALVAEQDRRLLRGLR